MRPSRFPCRGPIAMLASLACHAGVLLLLWLWPGGWATSESADGGTGNPGDNSGSGSRIVWLTSVERSSGSPDAATATPAPQPTVTPVALPQPKPARRLPHVAAPPKVEPVSVRVDVVEAEAPEPLVVAALAIAQAEPASAGGASGIDVAAAGGRDSADTARGSAEAGVHPGGSGGRSGAGGGGARSAHATFADYLVALSARVQERLPIPRLARRRGLEDGDEVIVRVVLDAAGALRRVELARSSGFASFDRDAVRTIERAAPFGPVPSDTRDAQLDFDLPIVYER